MIITLQCMAMRVYGHGKSTLRFRLFFFIVLVIAGPLWAIQPQYLILAKSAISVCIQSGNWESKKKNTNGPCVYGPLKGR